LFIALIIGVTNVKKLFICIFLLWSSFFANSAKATHVIPINGIVTTGALTRINVPGVNGGVLSSRQANDGFVDRIIRPISSTLTVSSLGEMGHFASSTTTAMANFNSANSGDVTIMLGREFSGIGASGMQDNQFLAGPSKFFYAFALNTDDATTIDVIYDVFGDGVNLSGFNGFSFSINQRTVVDLTNGNNPTVSGRVSINLPRTRSTTVFSIDNISAVNGLLSNDLSGSITGRFHFNIIAAPVPEPATWAMLIIGFGLIGGAARRRKIAIRMAYN
jgi:hypothetical protein